MFSKKIKFKNSPDLDLSAIHEGEDENSPLVILCHGYASSKDSVGTKNLAQKLVESLQTQKKLEILEGAGHDIKAGFGANELLANFFFKMLL